MTEQRFLVYALTCAGLAVLFWFLRIPIWFLFVILTLYFGYRVIVKKRPVAQQAIEPVFGVLGEYRPDDGSEDSEYGLYIELDGRAVFVDLREDQELDNRKLRAQALFEKQSDLQASLNKFRARNDKFAARHVASIGLHSDDLNRAEVFWSPDGYTLLVNYEFIDDN